MTIPMINHVKIEVLTTEHASIKLAIVSISGQKCTKYYCTSKLSYRDITSCIKAIAKIKLSDGNMMESKGLKMQIAYHFSHKLLFLLLYIHYCKNRHSEYIILVSLVWFKWAWTWNIYQEFHFLIIIHYDKNRMKSLENEIQCQQRIHMLKKASKMM